MSSGQRDGKVEPLGVSAVVRLISGNGGLRHVLNAPLIVSRQYRVPYGAGRSRDGLTTYIDEGVPERFLMGVEPDKYVAGHEGAEWWRMTRGADYWPSHALGLGVEHYLLKIDGHGDEAIAAYEKEWKNYISEDESDRVTADSVPPDLFLGPYESDPDRLDEKLLPILRAAQTRMVAGW